MHKITKILKQKEISFLDYKKIEKEWDELTICTQNSKAPCFYKQAKKHLTEEQKSLINFNSSKDPGKFRIFLKIMNKEFISQKKEKLVKLIKINALQSNPKIEEAIENLFLDLRDERDFIKEIGDSMKSFGLGNKIKTY